MNSDTKQLYPQTQKTKLEQHTKLIKKYQVKVLLKTFHLNGYTIGFMTNDLAITWSRGERVTGKEGNKIMLPDF